MSDAFFLLDLVSQGAAVQRILAGRTEEEKLAWIRARGALATLPGHRGDGGRLYRFESTTGQWCCFFFRDDQIVFLGDNSTFTPHETAEEVSHIAASPPRTSQAWDHAGLTLACLASLHFLLSVALWGMLVAIAIKQGDPISPVIRGALPATGLLLVSIASAIAQIKRRRRLGWRLLLAGVAFAAAVFIHDIRTRNWQLHYEHYRSDAPQQTFLYATWWWYDPARLGVG